MNMGATLPAQSTTEHLSFGHGHHLIVAHQTESLRRQSGLTESHTCGGSHAEESLYWQHSMNASTLPQHVDAGDKVGRWLKIYSLTTERRGDLIEAHTL